MQYNYKAKQYNSYQNQQKKCNNNKDKNRHL